MPDDSIEYWETIQYISNQSHLDENTLICAHDLSVSRMIKAGLRPWKKRKTSSTLKKNSASNSLYWQLIII